MGVCACVCVTGGVVVLCDGVCEVCDVTYGPGLEQARIAWLLARARSRSASRRRPPAALGGSDCG